MPPASPLSDISVQPPRGFRSRAKPFFRNNINLMTDTLSPTRRVSVSIKALEMKDEKEAIDQFGSSDSGASLGDILGAALREKAGSKE